MKKINNCFKVLIGIGVSLVLISNIYGQNNDRSKKQLVSLENIAGVLNSSKDGDTILIKEGTYRNLNITLSGEFKEIVVIMPEKPGGVIVTGKSTISVEKGKYISIEGILFNETQNNSALILNSSSNIQIKNNYFLRCGSSRNGFIVRIDRGSSDNEICYNTFEASRSMGIVITARSTNVHTKNNKDNKIFNNFFYNIPSVRSIYPNSDGNGLESIQIGQGVKDTETWMLNTTVSNNLFEKVIGDGGEIISVKTSGNKILNNTFLDNKSGITLRYGNNNTVSGNYLDNTSRGIRVFGSGQIISNNYIKNGDVGIQLPSADFKYGDKMTHSGYYQSENVKIENNIILNTKVASIDIGEGNRKLLPKNVEISKNKILLSEGAQDFKVNDTNKSKIALDIRDNVSLKSGIIQGLLNSNLTNSLLNVTSKSITGVDPFVNNDIRVGASWRRPN